MENNNPIVPAAPTPSTSSMPEFAAAPAAPAPVIPPATAMPEFGATQPAQAVPTQPVAAAQPVAEQAPVAQPTEPAAQQAEPTAQPTENAVDALVSTLGEISSEPAPATPVVTTPVAEAPAQTAEAQPAVTEVPSAVESAAPIESQPTSTQPVSPNPTQENPQDKKKPNMKLIAIIGVVAVALIGGIAAILIMTSQQKPQQKPAEVPVSSYDEGPDNSTEYAKLDKESALAYLTAVGKSTSYFPDNLLGEDDQDIFALDSEKGTALLLSYEDADKAKESVLTTDFLASIKGGKATKDSFEFTAKDDYVIVTPSEESAECVSACRGLSFDQKIINRYDFVPVTGDPVIDAMATPIPTVAFVKNDEATAKRYLPALAYTAHTAGVIYSGDFASTDTAFTYTLHALVVGIDQTAVTTSEAGVVPYAITSLDQTFTVDKTTGLLVVSEFLPGTLHISVTSEEVADLI